MAIRTSAAALGFVLLLCPCNLTSTSAAPLAIVPASVVLPEAGKVEVRFKAKPHAQRRVVHKRRRAVRRHRGRRIHRYANPAAAAAMGIIGSALSGVIYGAPCYDGDYYYCDGPVYYPPAPYYYPYGYRRYGRAPRRVPVPVFHGPAPGIWHGGPRPGFPRPGAFHASAMRGSAFRGGAHIGRHR